MPWPSSRTRWHNASFAARGGGRRSLDEADDRLREVGIVPLVHRSQDGVPVLANHLPDRLPVARPGGDGIGLLRPHVGQIAVDPPGWRPVGDSAPQAEAGKTRVDRIVVDDRTLSSVDVSVRCIADSSFSNSSLLMAGSEPSPPKRVMTAGRSELSTDPGVVIATVSRPP